MLRLPQWPIASGTQVGESTSCSVDFRLTCSRDTVARAVRAIVSRYLSDGATTPVVPSENRDLKPWSACSYRLPMTFATTCVIWSCGLNSTILTASSTTTV